MIDIQEISIKAKESIPNGLLSVDKWIEVYNQKFAELIVRECALIAGLMEHDDRKNIGAAILDRFGIK